MVGFEIQYLKLTSCTVDKLQTKMVYQFRNWLPSHVFSVCGIEINMCVSVCVCNVYNAYISFQKRQESSLWL